VSVRAEYIDGLKVELENLARRAASPVKDRRLAEVKSELDKYSSEPQEQKVETAVPGPISRSRAKS
jgi:hypothetical protein